MTAQRTRFDAVLFDWCGTLVEYPTHEDRFRPILERLGRPHDPDTLKRLVHAYEAAETEPAAMQADKRCDLSARDHAATKHLICEVAGIDSELATEIERSYGDFATYTTYPEVVDVITSLTDAGVKVAIISDFHVDLRPHLDLLGLLDRISGFALSCEVGVTKPDQAMFEAALTYVAEPPERCLMVGDNPHPDCGGAPLGISTLLLPLQRAPRPPLLDAVRVLVLGDVA